MIKLTIGSLYCRKMLLFESRSIISIEGTQKYFYRDHGPTVVTLDYQYVLGGTDDPRAIVDAINDLEKVSSISLIRGPYNMFF